MVEGGSGRSEGRCNALEEEEVGGHAWWKRLSMRAVVQPKVQLDLILI